MSESRIYVRVADIVRRAFEMSDFVFGPNTDIMSIAEQIHDPEIVEWIIEAVEREFAMPPPMVMDANGKQRRLQMLIPATLTVAELSAIVEEGAWPSQWALPGKYVSPWLA